MLAKIFATLNGGRGGDRKYNKAAQDQAVSTNCFKNKILKEEIDCKCGLCKQHEDTVDHFNLRMPRSGEGWVLTEK